MKCIILISAVCLLLGWCNGEPSNGVGAFAYQDSTGNRYGGTYGLRDGQIYDQQGNFPPNFQYQYQDLDNFFPDYFRNLEYLLQEAFYTNLENQRLAYNAATKAFDLTSNQAGYIPNFPHRFQPFNNFGGFKNFPGMAGPPPGFPGFPGFGNDDNMAYAGAAIGPGFKHQIASISPSNPDMPNVNILNRNAEPQGSRAGNNYRSVSSSSYSSSTNVNGQQQTSRGAETVVNDNGKVTAYKVTS